MTQISIKGLLLYKNDNAPRFRNDLHDPSA
jgi:hypothetical protein